MSLFTVYHEYDLSNNTSGLTLESAAERLIDYYYDDRSFVQHIDSIGGWSLMWGNKFSSISSSGFYSMHEDETIAKQEIYTKIVAASKNWPGLVAVEDRVFDDMRGRR